MSLLQFSNFGSTQLAGSISPVSTTANLLSGAGALFPAPVNGQYFILEFNDQATGQDYEIVHVTGRVGDTITMIRAQEGTSALTWNAGDLAFLGPTAGQQSLLQQTVVFAGNPNGNVAGTDGSLGTAPTFCWDTTDTIMWVCVLSGNAASAVWQTVGLLNRLFANADFFIATAGGGGSDSNPGTLAFPWLTRQHAWDFLVSNYDLNGFAAHIRVLDGAYTDGFRALGTVRGSLGPSSVVYTGNISTAASCSISCVGDCFGGDGGVQYEFKGFKLAAAPISGAQGFGIQAGGGSTINFSLTQFDVCGGAHVEAETGGKASAVGNYQITGDAPSHMYGHAGGLIFNDGTTITFVGTRTFSNSFARTDDAGGIESVDNTFAGSAGSVVGKRYSISTSGYITTQSGNPNYFPGTIAGTVDTNQYN